MALPERTAWVAAQCEGWELRADGLGLAHEHHARWLMFGIARALVPDPAALEAAFRAQDGQPWLIQAHSHACLVSRRKGPTRRLRAGGSPGDGGSLAGLQVPAWLDNGRLRFRRDRWAYAPRTFPRNERQRRAQQLRDAEDEVWEMEERLGPWPEGGDTAELERLRAAVVEAGLRRKFVNDPFIDCHRIMHSLGRVNYHDTRAPPFTLHWRCLPSTPARRARCLQPAHLGRGWPKDNSRHSKLHGLNMVPQAPLY